MEKFREMIHGDIVEFVWENDSYYAEDIYVEHEDGYVTEGDTHTGVLTHYPCPYCGSPLNDKGSPCHSCGNKMREY